MNRTRDALSRKVPLFVSSWTVACKVASRVPGLSARFLLFAQRESFKAGRRLKPHRLNRIKQKSQKATIRKRGAQDSM